MPVPPRSRSVLETDDSFVEALQARPNFPFIFVFYADDPGNWFVGSVGGVDYWLPKLQRLEIRPGACGMRTLAKGEPADLAYQGALDKVRRKGGVALDRALDYCHATPCKDPKTRTDGAIHHDQFETPRVPKGRRKATVKFTADVEARNAWLLWLIEEGHVPAPDPEVIDENVARLAERTHARALRQELRLPGNTEALDPETLPANVGDALKEARRVEAAELPAAPTRAVQPPPKRRATKAKTTPAPKPKVDPADG